MGERRHDLAGEARERILAAQTDQVDALAQLGAESQVIPPYTIDLEQRDEALGALDRFLTCGVDERCPAIRRALPDIGHDLAANERLPSFHEAGVLFLDHRGIAGQRLPDLEVLSLD